MKARVALSAFNRGLVSPLGLARVAEEDKAAGRVKLSAEVHTNYMPRTLGSMMLRPGIEYIAAMKNNNFAVHIPFLFEIPDDMAYLQFTDQNMRVFIDDVAITRPSVLTAITNGTFGVDVLDWTNTDESGATSSWQMGGYLALLGTGFNRAVREQLVSVSAQDKNVLHGLRIVIQRGPVSIKVGSSTGNDDYFGITLGTGVHSLAFTPADSFFIEFSSRLSYTVLVDSVSIESSGIVDIPSPWLEADLRNIRWEQSGDVIYVDCKNYQQRKIERWGPTSWSIVLYDPEDGPFRSINTDTVTLTPSAISGDITLTSSAPVFKETNIGSLYKIESIGQTVNLNATGADQWSDPVRVTGVDSSRIFNISVDVDGSWSGTVRVQRSVAEPGDWSDTTLSYTTDTTTTHDDGLDNQIIWYRIGVKTGEYVSGTAALSISYGSGSNTGIVKVTEFNNSSSVNVVVLDALGGTDASANWYEGLWSDRRGFTTAVALYEGRLAHAGKGSFIASESDAYEDFDERTEGDSGPINRTIGSGPVDNINWLLSGSRLVIGAESREISTRQAFDDFMTPTNFGLKDTTTLGSAAVPPVKIDDTAYFVQRGGTQIQQLVYDPSAYSYTGNRATTLCPEVTGTGIVRMAIQRMPDTRNHCVREDGKVAVMVSDTAENVSCWILVETDGDVEDVFVMPGSREDSVYYSVKRTINGATVRYLEKWALESECQGGTYVYQGSSTLTIPVIVNEEVRFPDGTVVTARDSSGSKIGNYTVADGEIILADAVTYVSLTPSLYKLGDSHIIYDGTAATSIPAAHLEGESVVVWADGLDVGAHTVTGGVITLTTAAEKVMIGLYYRSRYKSVKLAYGAEGGTALTQIKRVDHIAPILRDTHYQGLKYGPDFDNLSPLPLIYRGKTTPADTVYSEYDDPAFSFAGKYNTDSRVVLQSEAPRPCTLLGLVISLDTNER